jgi:hypothetical protein
VTPGAIRRGIAIPGWIDQERHGENPACGARGGSCTTGNRPVLFVVQSVSGFRISIAITIAMENFSGKIAIRFFLCNRILLFPEKTDPEIFFSNRIAIENPFREQTCRWNTRSDRNFFLKIDPRF